MAKRQNKPWAPSWRQEQERGARAIQHQFSRIAHSAQRGGEAWTVEEAANRLAEVRAALEEAEATLERYQEREAA
jgi:hypothetical protein